MTPLCRHILAAGHPCPQPAVHDTHYCRHHGQVKKHTRRAPRSPNDFTFTLPLVYPEDRAAIQFNLNLVLQAFNDHKIDSKTADSFNRLLRSCRINLGKTPLLEEPGAKAVQRVILTPEGEEIALPREALEEGESPLHHKNCPCQRCAEEFRNAPPEQHHADCECGLCEPVTEPGAFTQPGHNDGCPILDAPFAARVGGDGLSDQPEPQLLTNGCHSERSETQWSEGEEPAVPQPSDQLGAPSLEPAFGATRVGEHDRQSREARATTLSSTEHTTDLISREPNLHDYLYGDEIRKYEAQYAARARAAIEAGLDPPPYEPFDPKKRESECQRRHKEYIAEIEKNREIGREIWNRRYPDQAVEYTPYLSWGDQQDLKLAHMKKPREEEEERSRAAANAASDAPIANDSPRPAC